MGEVYDVTKGKKHYNKEGYGFFIGKDASRAFVTGDFEGDLTDEVDDFDTEQCQGLVGWRDFYRKTYDFKGFLVGRFYKPDGKATQHLLWVEAQAKKAKTHEEKQREYEAQFPQCNVRWNEAEGGAVWCDDGRYPRKVLSKDADGRPNPRCLCFKDLGWSDLRQVYPDCKPDATTCQTSPPTPRS